MTKQVVVGQVLDEHRDIMSQRTAEAVVDTVFRAVERLIAETGVCALRGFGTFLRLDTPERPGRNPQTGEALTIAAGFRVAFRPAPALKAAVSPPKPKPKRRKGA